MTKQEFTLFAFFITLIVITLVFDFVFFGMGAMYVPEMP